jgi:hypothetical protein
MRIPNSDLDSLASTWGVQKRPKDSNPLESFSIETMKSRFRFRGESLGGFWFFSFVFANGHGAGTVSPTATGQMPE